MKYENRHVVTRSWVAKSEPLPYDVLVYVSQIGQRTQHSYTSLETVDMVCAVQPNTSSAKQHVWYIFSSLHFCSRVHNGTERIWVDGRQNEWRHIQKRISCINTSFVCLYFARRLTKRRKKTSKLNTTFLMKQTQVKRTTAHTNTPSAHTYFVRHPTFGGKWFSWAINFIFYLVELNIDLSHRLCAYFLLLLFPFFSSSLVRLLVSPWSRITCLHAYMRLEIKNGYCT